MNSTPGLIMLVTKGPGDTLLRVNSHSPSALTVSQFDSEWKSLAQLVSDAERPLGEEAVIKVTEAFFPVGQPAPRSFGLGMTYADHSQEVGLDDVVVFEKRAEPSSIQAPIPFRPSLDYEAEVGLLLHRQEPRLFGYFIHNDLTDRMSQALRYSKKAMSSAFSAAKSFEGSNRISPILAIGDERLWSALRVDFFVNGEKRQTVQPVRNVLTPSQIHMQAFGEGGFARNQEWILAGTGTPAGTVFRAPSTSEKLKLFLRAGLRRRRAIELWMNSFDFLKSGDRLRFVSDQLGTFESQVT